MASIPVYDLLNTKGLHWISRFGWLRARELGGLLWPNAKSESGDELDDIKKADNQRIMSHRLITRWKRNKWVLQRNLPDSCGAAFVLTNAGARFLSYKLGTTVRPGHNWGRTEGGTWTPPVAWQHELLVNVLMCTYVSWGHEIKTEIEIRAENTGKGKYPDGMTRATINDVERTYWIEVESAEKSGKYMLALAQALVKVQRGTAPVLSGWQATSPIVAFRSDMVDLRGNPIDHKNRIKRAISRHIGTQTQVIFAKLLIRNKAFHLADIDAKPETIFPPDFNDMSVPYGPEIFHCNSRGSYEAHVLDINGETWTLKVYHVKNTSSFRYEIWNSVEEKDGFHIDSLDQGFRVSRQIWNRDYYDESKKKRSTGSR